MKRTPVAKSWDSLLDRFDKFVSMPCLAGSGPDMNRSKAVGLREKVREQLKEALKKKCLPRGPRNLTQRHVSQMVKSMKTAGGGPSHQALWDGLWRAIIFDCDNYTCHFCYRSGAEGVTIPEFGPLALRLQLDHIKPRSHGGDDFRFSNMRTTCRLCNQGRFRLQDDHFRAELLSLAKAVCAAQIRTPATS